MPFSLDRLAKKAAKAVSQVKDKSNQMMFGAEKKPEKPQKPARPPSPPAVAETAANMLEDFVAEGKTVRFRSMESNKFLRIFPNGHIDAFGGNGPLPYFKLSGTDRYHVRLLNVHSEPLGLSFPVGGVRPAAIDEGADVILDANEDGTVCIIDPSGKYCLAVHGSGLFPVPKAVNKSTCFALMVGNEEIKLTDDDTALPDMFMQGLDGEELEEEFDGLNQLSPQERIQRVTEMDPFARHRFHEYKAYKLRKAIERKQNRRFKRAETGRNVDEDKFNADIEALNQRIAAVLAAPVVGEEQESLDIAESDDEIDQEEFEAAQESKGDELARAEAEAAEAERVAQEKRRLAEEARQRMEEERRRIEEEARAALAAAAAEAAAAEADEEEPDEQEQDDEVNELNEISMCDGATEYRIDLPDPIPSLVANAEFDAEVAAKAVYKACRGYGCDEKVIIQTILPIVNDQRQQLMKTFKTMYGEDMVSTLERKLGGKFKKLVLATLQTPADYDATCLYSAMRGFGTSNHVLIEIICTRSSEQLAAIKSAYERLFQKDLEEQIASETSGSYKRLLISLLAGGRNSSTEVDVELAKLGCLRVELSNASRKEAELLSKNVRWSRDESVLNQILAVRSPIQIRATLAEYKALTGYDINARLKKYLSSKLAQSYIAIIACARNPARYFAEHIFKAFRGFGMDEDTVIRIMVSRSEIDLGSIRELYPDIAGVTLHKAIKSECTSDFRRGLNQISNV